MLSKDLLKILERYRKTSRKSALRRGYLSVFEKKMIYRTTKTENPETSWEMVTKVLRQLH